MKTVGIDASKNKHDVCILDEDKMKLCSFHFSNSMLGFAEFNKRLAKYGKDFVIGFESSGVYHQGILHHLSHEYENIILLNPKRIKAHRKSLGYEYKTDKIDSYVIAHYLSERCYSKNLLPDKYPFLRQLCRTRTKLVHQQTRVKNRINSDLHVIFPEYKQCFSDIFCKSSLNFLKNHVFPDEIREMEVTDVQKILLKGSKNTSINHAKKILLAAEDSFGVKKYGLDFEMRLAIQNLEMLQEQIVLLDNKIEYNFEKIFNPLGEIKGMNKVFAAGIIAETGDISYFNNRNQYYNFTGLAPRFAQSGQFESKFNHINKCGSSYLRHYLFQAAIGIKRFNPEFNSYFVKKHHLEKKSKDEAHVYCAKKLCHIIFKLLKSNQKFCPEKLAH